MMSATVCTSLCGPEIFRFATFKPLRYALMRWSGAGIWPSGNRNTTKRAAGFTEMTLPGTLPPGVTMMGSAADFLSREAHPSNARSTSSLRQREIIGMVGTTDHGTAGDVNKTHIA